MLFSSPWSHNIIRVQNTRASYHGSLSRSLIPHVDNKAGIQSDVGSSRSRMLYRVLISISLPSPPPALVLSCVLTLHSAWMSRQIALKNSWRWRCTRCHGSHRRENHKAKAWKHSCTPQHERNLDSLRLQHRKIEWQTHRGGHDSAGHDRIRIRHNRIGTLASRGRRHGFVF